MGDLSASGGGPAPANRIDQALNPEQETSLPNRTLPINSVRVPRFLYGTAWKEERTRRLTELALHHGFRGILALPRRTGVLAHHVLHTTLPPQQKRERDKKV